MGFLLFLERILWKVEMGLTLISRKSCLWRKMLWKQSFLLPPVFSPLTAFECGLEKSVVTLDNDFLVRGYCRLFADFDITSV